MITVYAAVDTVFIEMESRSDFSIFTETRQCCVLVRECWILNGVCFSVRGYSLRVTMLDVLFCTNYGNFCLWIFYRRFDIHSSSWNIIRECVWSTISFHPLNIFQCIWVHSSCPAVVLVKPLDLRVVWLILETDLFTQSSDDTEKQWGIAVTFLHDGTTSLHFSQFVFYLYVPRWIFSVLY